MDQKPCRNSYNGNGDSASDLETPYDSVAKETVQQREKVDHYANQFHLSNVVPHYNNNNTGSNIFSETYISENEFSNSSDIMEETPRKKPLISLNENLYMNVAPMKDITVAGTFTSPNITAETNSGILKTVTSPDRSNNETCPSSNQRLQDTLLSPNNNSNNISIDNTSPIVSQSNVSNGIASSFLVGIYDGTSASETPQQCLSGFESKSSWQFCPRYGLPGAALDSSEETPSPNSQMSPDISCLPEDLDSLSEGDVISDGYNDLESRQGKQERNSLQREENLHLTIDSTNSSELAFETSPAEMLSERDLCSNISAKDEDEVKYISSEHQLLNGNCQIEGSFLPEVSTDNVLLVTDSETNSKGSHCYIPTEAIYANICPEAHPGRASSAKGFAERITELPGGADSAVKLVPITSETIEIQRSPEDLVSLQKSVSSTRSSKKETVAKVPICIKGSKRCPRNPRTRKTDVADHCLPLRENSRVKHSDTLQRDTGLNLLAFPKSTSLSFCEIHPVSFANPRSPMSNSSENSSSDFDSRSAASALCNSSPVDPGSSVKVHGAGLESRPHDLHFSNQSPCFSSQTNFLQYSGSHGLPNSSPTLLLLTDTNASERFISLKDYSETSQKDSENCSSEQFNKGVNTVSVAASQPSSVPSQRLSCWQVPPERIIRRRDPKHRRPVSFHGSEDPRKFYAEDNLYENLSPQNFPQLGVFGHRCTSRQTQTDFNRPCGLKQSNSFTAMPRHRACQANGCMDRPSEGFKIGTKVNLGVSSLRSAFPVVQRQYKQQLPTSHTSDNFTGVINSLESSQSTPNFVGLCKLSCHPNYQPQLRPHSCKETSWRYTRPVSDSGLFLRNDLIRRSQGQAPNSETSRVPEFLRQISEHAQRAAMSESAKKDRTFPPGNRNNFERRLSDPSYCLPQPPKRSTSLGGSLVLAKCLSEPSFKNNQSPNCKNNPTVNDPIQPSPNANSAAPEGVYENVENTPNIPSPKVPPMPQASLTESVDEPIYENLPSSNPEPIVSPSRLSSISDSDSDSSDCVMNERRESYHSSDSSDADTETDIGSNADLDSGDNFDDSSDDTSDTVSMDDLLSRLGVVTTQDGDADDEDGFQDSSDDEEEDELLLPISAPTRMCDRPPSPYPGLGDSTDEDRPMFVSGVFHSVSYYDVNPNNGPARPVRSQTEPDFLDFEILIPEDYGIQHPPSYTDLFPIGTPRQLDMPPSYDDAVRPFSVHQDHFDYSGFENASPTNNNRLSLPAPDWIAGAEDYLTNPPPAYDEAVLNLSGRSNDELSNQSQESPIRRSRGRRMLNGLRRFARRIFR